MSPLAMNILAYLAILAIVGLILAGVMLATSVLTAIAHGKKALALTKGPRQSAMQTVNVAKGIGKQSMSRVAAMQANGVRAVGSVKRAAVHVKTTLREVEADVQEARAATSGEGGSAAVNFMRMLWEIVGQARATDRPS